MPDIVLIYKKITKRWQLAVDKISLTRYSNKRCKPIGCWFTFHLLAYDTRIFIELSLYKFDSSGIIQFCQVNHFDHGFEKVVDIMVTSW